MRRTSPPVYEPYYALWPGPVSDSSFAVTIDPAVPMKARDGTVLMNFVGTPVGKGPFGVVMERTPYLRIDTAAAVFWASRGFIYVKQDVRGRGGSGGVLDMNAMQESDGYDAVEWAAKLPGANGKVGMIGRSNPGLYAWYAAIAAPPHLAAIAPAVATADPLRIVPYIDMVFSPTIVPWLCLTQVRETMSDMSNLDVETAFNSLPVIASAEKSGCGRPKYWNDWFDHQKLDAYWRGLSIEARLNRVKVPVLGIGGWYDDARGTIRNYMGLDSLKTHPFQRIVHGRGRAQGHRLRERQLRPDGPHRPAPAPAPLVRSLPARASTTAWTASRRSTSSSWATTRGARKRNSRSRARSGRTSTSTRRRQGATAAWATARSTRSRPRRSRRTRSRTIPASRRRT